MICFTLFFGFIGPVWTGLLPGGPSAFFANYELGLVICETGLVGLPYILALLVYPMMRIHFIRNKIESIGVSAFVAYLYAMAIAVAYPLSAYWITNMGNWIAQRYAFPEFDWVLPNWMVPPANIVQVTVTGGPIQWANWLPSILFFWIFQIVFSMFGLSLATIFRKQWIDVEKVPFPQAQIAHGIMERTTGLSRMKKPFAIGVLVGLVAQLPITLALILPWFPDIFGWRASTMCAMGIEYITPNSPLAFIVGLQTWNKQPLIFIMAYFVPLATQFSFVFFYIVQLVLSQVTYMMGYYTGLAEKAGCGRSRCPPTPFWGAPLGYKMWSHIGGSIGLTLMLVFHSRNYIANTFRTAFGKKKEISEEEEPLSYRGAYLMVITSVVTIIAFCMLSFDMSLPVAILMPITVFVFWLSETRVWGMSSMSPSCGSHANVFYRWFVWPTYPETWTRECIFANGVSAWVECQGPEMYGSMGSIYASFAAYKVAAMTNIHPRNIFKMLLIGLLLGPLATIIGYIWVIHTFGLTHLALGGWVGGGGPGTWTYESVLPTWPSTGSVMEWTPSVFFGIFSVVILSLLRARFVWFPLDPVGFWIAFSYIGMVDGMWLPFAVSWVLKLLTLRIGGSKAYEEMGVPFATGAAAGCFISIILGAILGITRFFVPF